MFGESPASLKIKLAAMEYMNLALTHTDLPERQLSDVSEDAVTETTPISPLISASIISHTSICNVVSHVIADAITSSESVNSIHATVDHIDLSPVDVPAALALSDLRVLARLGSGATADVFKVQHIGTGTVSALKVISKEKLSTEETTLLRHECKTMVHVIGLEGVVQQQGWLEDGSNMYALMVRASNSLRTSLKISVVVSRGQYLLKAFEGSWKPRWGGHPLLWSSASMLYVFLQPTFDLMVLT